MKSAKTVAIAGNPNVGKSTLFNSLTGLKQHTGNWAGKTVASAKGSCRTRHYDCTLVDIPGTYSLLPHSAEEEVARDFLCFQNPDAVIVVCDATCLERNLNLVLQIMEITPSVILCVNLMDEAARKGISIDFSLLRERLGIPVVGVCARKKKGLEPLLQELDRMLSSTGKEPLLPVRYEEPLEQILENLTDTILDIRSTLGRPLLNPDGEDIYASLSARFLALRLLDRNASFEKELKKLSGFSPFLQEAFEAAAKIAVTQLADAGITSACLEDIIVNSLVQTAESLSRAAVTCKNPHYRKKDFLLDGFFTSRFTGYPVMIALLALVFWLTIAGANYPSALLSRLFSFLEASLSNAFFTLGAPDWLHGVLVLGAFRVLAWVVAVMLPPMAIFFPVFTLLEDIGYLPRIAYNMDCCFKKCHACGKQSLTMCMGFGCNAAGVTGCRIIDSPRERLIAILTNNFVPCNGRFPTLIAIISMFFAGAAGALQSLLSALILTGFILLGIGMTFVVSRILSQTALKGMPSSFTLELPPYRRPQAGRILLRSLFDRTFFVLGRAAAVAAPAGILIWILANITIQGQSLLFTCAGFLDPFARLMGLDGVILIAFILGLPANEIVLPIILMAYLSGGSLVEFDSLQSLRSILVLHGWTPVTALCTMLFSMLHWPCSTTLITIKKETGSLKWTLVSFLLPTFIGITVCMLVNLSFHLLSSIM